MMRVRVVSVTTTHTVHVGPWSKTFTSTRPLREAQPTRAVSTSELRALLAAGAEVKAYWV